MLRSDRRAQSGQPTAGSDQFADALVGGGENDLCAIGLTANEGFGKFGGLAGFDLRRHGRNVLIDHRFNEHGSLVGDGGV